MGRWTATVAPMAGAHGKSWIVCLVVMVGCFASTAHSPDDAPVRPREDPDWDAYFADLCAFYERCDSPRAHLFGTGAECLAAYGFLATQFATHPEFRELHARRAACVEGFRTVECPADDGSHSATLEVSAQALQPCLGGLVGEGQACGADVGCESGLVCVGWDRNACGVCTLREAVRCEGTVDCGPGWYCAAGRCVRRRGLGERCSAGYECATSRCTGTCSKGGVGERCDRDLLCGPFLVCLEGVCVAPGREGEACAPGAFSCHLPLACHRGTCVAQRPHDNPLGGPCSSSDRCVAGGVCEQGECVRAAKLGEACRHANNDCAPDAYCRALPDPGREGELGVCEPTKPPGAECTMHHECDSFNCNDDRRCVPPLTCAEPPKPLQ